jgi:tRNA-(guanine-N1)-methyltransferase
VRIDIFTIFPRILEGPLRESLLGKAVTGGTIQIGVHDLREWATDRHHSVDDESFGGGPGMVMRPGPVFAAVESLDPDRGRVLVLAPSGRRLDQAFVRDQGEK